MHGRLGPTCQQSYDYLHLENHELEHAIPYRRLSRLRIPWFTLCVLQACFVSDAELREAADRDGDGYHPAQLGGPDCDNDDPAVNPGATEVCGDGIDNDCDGVIDDDGPDAPLWYRDDDGDGWGVADQTLRACSPPSGYTAEPGAGWSVAVGDHDGDGYDDLAASTPYRNTDQGKVYLLFGSGI